MSTTHLDCAGALDPCLPYVAYALLGILIAHRRRDRRGAACSRPATEPALRRGFGFASVAAAAITWATMAGASPSCAAWGFGVPAGLGEAGAERLS
ncbi:hypothetical protein AB0O75_25500 [Streptomyces sp. NPDC088921]|uniref:hypothetical protein n=1 Tax=unclassified Streptomyces TaxID=2593676 RepID=UPI00342F67BD